MALIKPAPTITTSTGWSFSAGGTERGKSGQYRNSTAARISTTTAPNNALIDFLIDLVGLIAIEKACADSAGFHAYQKLKLPDIGNCPIK
ncbi:hypothetical protein AVHY2522_02370 [Acidovorax sp. SUPP2522]|uniref:hypothetical protein n=1 Tax=unclassified Acidovorax TaxID=2684926 RepID=UPI00234AE554|nr:MULTISPECIES: hypothetical protein [unclassified Acidovorax]WCN00550.1 hypothetical protein M5C96_05915 [Acidovorax sp. GBBC 1281]GKT13805.1 hypothetical protein AVHY2522_02370 [Acidovorax sp. SUPP2522]